MGRIVEFTKGDENLIVERVLERIERELERSAPELLARKPKRKPGFGDDEKTALMNREDTGPNLSPPGSIPAALGIPPMGEGDDVQPSTDVSEVEEDHPITGPGPDDTSHGTTHLNMLEDRTGLNAVKNNTKREIIVLTLALLFLVAGAAYYYLVVRPSQIP